MRPNPNVTMTHQKTSVSMNSRGGTDTRMHEEAHQPRMPEAEHGLEGAGGLPQVHRHRDMPPTPPASGPVPPPGTPPCPSRGGVRGHDRFSPWLDRVGTDITLIGSGLASFMMGGEGAVPIERLRTHWSGKGKCISRDRDFQSATCGAIAWEWKSVYYRLSGGGWFPYRTRNPVCSRWDEDSRRWTVWGEGLGGSHTERGKQVGVM